MRLLQTRPRLAYGLAVAACLVMTSAAIGLPPDRVTPSRTMDIAVAVLIGWSGLAALFFPRVVKASREAPTTTVLVRAALALSAESFGIAERFITGSAVVAWLGCAVAVATLTAIALSARRDPVL